nr:MAG TPA: hypothetical protein [Caudoviricetes sp.]
MLFVIFSNKNSIIFLSSLLIFANHLEFTPNIFQTQLLAALLIVRIVTGFTPLSVQPAQHP